MKVIEMLLQGKKVLNIAGNAYWEMKNNEIIMTWINSDRKENVTSMPTNAMLREGKEYKGEKYKYLVSDGKNIFELLEGRHNVNKITCDDIAACKDALICNHCKFNKNGIDKDKVKIYKIEL